ncbi:non-ribosomal peptide synthetase [Pseudomonas sp. RIT-PI-AD]|uniref:non-ribosomal peptide synthetase n=1 Tax=Pseudomonas sp. RIT-PI-AD TaxID=3035294 RepID=UPI0021D9958F|nr:non-ribosomal peptide synthetase [Pseudomonas sp. RIT-PI-AD]
MNQTSDISDDDLLALLAADEALAVQRIPPRPAETSAPLSHAQQRLWFLQRYDPEDASYNLPRLLRIDGRLEAESLAAALRKVIDRHAILRTAFVEGEAGPEQRIFETRFELSRIDLCNLPAEQREARLAEALREECERPFDLTRPGQLRARLFHLEPEKHALVITLHHIVSDAWSNPLLLADLAEAYRLATGIHPEAALPPLPIQYADYARWERDQDGRQAASLAYWQDYLGQHLPPLELPADHPRALDGERPAGYSAFTLDARQSAAIQRAAAAQGSTAFVILLAAWQLLLHRYSGQDEFAVGVPYANRDLPETQGLVGCFMSTQLYRARLYPALRVSELLARLRRESLAALEHADVPFERLLEGFDVDRSAQDMPLFQTLFNWQVDASGGPALDLPGLSLRVQEGELTQAKFDLSLDVASTPAGIAAQLEYNAALFEPATIERLGRHWTNLLQAMLDHPEARIDELPLLDDQEQRTLVQGWNARRDAFPGQGELCVHRLFEAQVAHQPQATALLLGDRHLSYAELNARANRLAHALQARGVGPDAVIGIAVERSLEMVIALLAVLKAGGAYVPLDPDYPGERLRGMIEDSGMHLLLTQPHLLPSLSLPEGLDCLCVSADATELDAYPAENPRSAVGPQNLAYVMFTSGSTGRPKGVGIAHQALTRHAWVSLEFFGLTGDDRILQFSTFNFDGFVEQLYPALICGASVVLRGPELWDSETFYATLIEQGISVVDVTTAYWFMLARDFASAGPRPYGRLRQFHAGGEAMPPEGLGLWRQAGLGGVRLLNTYGPTEATVTVTSHDCTAYVNGTQRIPLQMPIGHVLPARSIHILDQGMQPQPIGVVGELLIGGDLLARGYFKRPGLTAERFIPDPFGAPGSRLYRTGDLARYRDGGLIEYAGRIDHQVKIRGFRIELGEIEARLLENPQIREALVTAIDSPGGLQLAAYLAPHDERLASDEPALPAWREAVKTRLRQQLPDYMLPTHLMVMRRLPLSPNGKIDRKALPLPEAGDMQPAYRAAQTEPQRQLAAIWQDVLGLEQVGLDDHFFELGGHSLLATQVISRIRQRLGWDLPLRSLFEQPRLEDFAALAAAAREDETPPLERVPRDRPLPLSYAQMRQWFLWKLDPQSPSYSIPLALRLRGTLDVDALQRSFAALVARHEILRTRYLERQGDVFQQIEAVDAWVPPLQRRDLAENASLQALIEEEASRPFDLEREPPMRLVLVCLGADDHALVAVLHHICFDGWSVPVMVDELTRLYAADVRGQAPALPERALQYADYAVWQRRWMESGELQRQLDYWRTRLGQAHDPLELPTDHPRHAQRTHSGRSFNLELPPALAADLRRLAQEQDTTLFTLLLASLQILLHRYSGQTDIRVGVPSANRNRLEVEGLIGLFVNTLVLGSEIQPDCAFDRFLQGVKQDALAAQAHQDLPFERLVEALQPDRQLGHTPLFQVMYNHRSGQGPSAPLNLPGLQISALEAENPGAKFDLMLSTFEEGNALAASFSYASELFDASTIERMAGHWQTLLRALVAKPSERLDRLPLLSATESQALLRQWNPQPAPHASADYLHRRFERQAVRAPQAIAVSDGDRHLSYDQVNRMANRLARRLGERGVGPESLVGVALGRSAELIVALLAVLKTGAAYVPLDPDYPVERLEYMIEDSGLELVLTRRDLLEHLPPMPARVSSLCLDADPDLAACSDANLGDEPVAPDALAYVIYTSGSTGRPKGAQMTHGNVTRLFEATDAWFGFDERDVWTLFHSFAFDFSVWEIFGALLHGGRLVIVPYAVSRAPDQFARLLREEGVTVLNQTPSAFRPLARVLCESPDSPSQLALRFVVFGGEALELEMLAPWFARFGDRTPHLINMYGITETTVHVTYRPLRATDLSSGVRSPIGHAIPDLGWYLLDDSLQPVPPGCFGELYVAGAGLARGYLRRPGLTAERFIPSPFAETPGQRLYRTGDLARCRADGEFEYVGRNDQQVKIRGFRIELGEIEARLQAHEALREARVVTLAVDGTDQLAGYLVPRDAALLGADEEARDALYERLRAHLLEQLPDYMVPAHLILLAALPLTSNGKLDRKALPAPALNRPRRYVAPASEMQRRLAAIWEEALDVQGIGATDNFFELGGHSLQLIAVIARIRDSLGVDIPVKEFYVRGALDRLADWLEAHLAQRPAENDLDLILDAFAELEETHV